MRDRFGYDLLMTAANSLWKHGLSLAPRLIVADPLKTSSRLSELLDRPTSKAVSVVRAGGEREGAGLDLAAA